MKVLVSGANGFIGRAMCTYLLRHGYSVVPAVRKPHGIADECVVNGDVSWSRALSGCNSIIHLAGCSQAPKGNELDQLQIMRATNVSATLDLANRAAAAGVRRFVFMSTVKVNGESTKLGKFFRADDPVAPVGPYAISKWEAEQGLRLIALKTGLEVVVIRPPLVYGFGVKGNFLSLMQWVEKKLPLPLGAVHNRRSLIALDNLVSFTSLCADIDASPNAKGEVFLVSDGKDVSTVELLNKIAAAYGYKSRLFPVPVRFIRLAARLMRRASIAERLLESLVIDDSKARNLLGWHPPVSMDEQLSMMVNAASI